MFSNIVNHSFDMVIGFYDMSCHYQWNKVTVAACKVIWLLISLSYDGNTIYRNASTCMLIK